MTTDRHDPSAASELDDEFWGQQTEWTPQPHPSTERAGLGVAIGRWWNGLLGGDAGAERSHGVGHRMHGRLPPCRCRRPTRTIRRSPVPTTTPTD